MKAATLLALVLLSACGGGGDAYTPVAAVPASPNPKECVALQKLDGAPASCP